jgi:hypothetical protein
MSSDAGAPSAGAKPDNDPRDARIPMAPSPFLVGRRFRPRFFWSAGNFFVGRQSECVPIQPRVFVLVERWEAGLHWPRVCV